MKRKILIAATTLVVLAGGAFLIYQNLPEKRYAKHMIKARLYAKEGNITAARSEYEAAFKKKEGYTPWVTLEVLDFNNKAALIDRQPEVALENSRQFVQANPHSIEGRAILADIALKLGEFQTAFEQIEAILSKDPAHFPARLMMIRMRNAQGRLDLAEDQLRYLSKHYPDSLGVLLPLAENLLRQGNPGEARAFLAEIPEKHQNLPQVRLLRIDSYLLERKVDSAEAMLASWSAEDPQMALPIQVRQARLLSAQGKPQQGLALLDTFLTKEEKNLPAFEQAAYLAVQNGNPDSALKLFESMGTIKPEVRGNLMRLGIFLHLHMGNPARALENLKTLTIVDKNPSLLPLTAAIYTALDQKHKIDEELAAFPDSIQRGVKRFHAQLEPDKNFVGQWALVQFYQGVGMRWMAFSALQKWQKSWPKNTLATTLLAAMYSSLGDAKTALRLIESIPDTTLAYTQNLIRLNLAAGQRDKAVRLAKQLEATHPSLPGLHQFLGDIALESGATDDASRHYEKELALKPDNVAVINNLAWHYGVTLRDFTKAKPHLDKLTSMKVIDPRIYDTIGWVMVLAGEQEKGATYLNTALQLVPDQPTFNFHEAYRLALVGDKIKAKERVQMALKTGRNFPEKASADSLLKNL